MKIDAIKIKRADGSEEVVQWHLEGDAVSFDSKVLLGNGDILIFEWTEIRRRKVMEGTGDGFKYFIDAWEEEG